MADYQIGSNTGFINYDGQEIITPLLPDSGNKFELELPTPILIPDLRNQQIYYELDCIYNYNATDGTYYDPNRYGSETPNIWRYYYRKGKYKVFEIGNISLNMIILYEGDNNEIPSEIPLTLQNVNSEAVDYYTKWSVLFFLEDSTYTYHDMPFQYSNVEYYNDGRYYRSYLPPIQGTGAYFSNVLWKLSESPIVEGTQWLPTSSEESYILLILRESKKNNQFTSNYLSPLFCLASDAFYNTQRIPYTQISTNTTYQWVEPFHHFDVSINEYIGAPIDNGLVISSNILSSLPSISEPGGGLGDFSNYSDIIDFPSLPSLSVVNSGLVTLYNPSISQLNQFNNWLWSDNMLDIFEKMFAQPMELIIALCIVPIAPQNLINDTLSIGGVDTNIPMSKLSSQYVVLDCGTISVKEYYGSALDYGTYTKISIYLPFINTVPLKTDEIMGGTISVRYYIDLFNGSCVAMIKCNRNGLSSVLYSFEGNIAVNLPLTSHDFSQVYQSLVKAGISIASNPTSISNIVDSAMSVMNSKPNVQRSGTVSSSGGLLGLKKPYLIIERPIQSLPKNYSKFVGYPSNITAKLSSLSGYTEIDEIISNNLKCTKQEQNEIISLLKSGVYL